MGPIDPILPESYAPAAGIRRLSLGGRTLVYAEDRQQVLELNDTADRIWRALGDAGSVTAAEQQLDGLGLSPELVADAVLQWTLGGFLAPRSLELLERKVADRTLVLDELVVELRFRGVGCEDLDPVFGHLYGAREGRRRRLSIIEHAGQLLFYVERRLVLVGARDGLAAHVKTALTDLYVDTVEDGFLTHGAWLVRGGCGLLLSGAPRAGKTTLALALAASCWRYGGDDIVRIDAAGAARGVPFAAAVKSGSVPLLSGMWPELERLPAWVRSDGQRARYLLPEDRAAPQALPPSVVVTLARRPGAGARTRPISAVDALGAIVGSAYARRWRMTGEALCALAQGLDRAFCVQLEYSDLGEAVRALGEIARVQAEAA